MLTNSLSPSFSLNQVWEQVGNWKHQNTFLSRLVSEEFRGTFEDFLKNIQKEFQLFSFHEAKEIFQSYIEKKICQGEWDLKFHSSVKVFLKKFQWKRVKFEDYLFENTPESLKILLETCQHSLQELDLTYTSLHFEELRKVSQCAQSLQKIVLNQAVINCGSRHPHKQLPYERAKIFTEPLDKIDPLITCWEWTIYFPKLEIFEAQKLNTSGAAQKRWSIVSPILALASFNFSVGLQDVMVTTRDSECQFDTQQTWLEMIAPSVAKRKSGWQSTLWTLSSDPEKRFQLAQECEKKNLVAQFEAISLLPGSHPYPLYLDKMISDIIPMGYVKILHEFLKNSAHKLGILPAEVIKQYFLLHEAALSPHIQILEKLLEFKKDLADYPHTSVTKPIPPLVLAYQTGHLEHVSQLIPISSDEVLTFPFNFKNSKIKRTLLHYALEHHHVGIPHKLLQQSSELLWIGDSNKTTPFHLLMEKKSVDLFEFVEVIHHSVDDLGWNPLHYAARGGSLELAKMWFKKLTPERKREILHQGTKEGLTPLHLTVQYGHVKFMEWLLEQETNVNQEDIKGRNALWFAVAEGKDLIVPHLLLTSSYRAIQENHNPFEVAIQRGRWTTLKYLLERAIPYHQNGRGDFWPLAAALIIHDEQSFQLLLTKGLSKFATEPQYGLNLLHIAIARGDQNWFKDIKDNPELLKAFDNSAHLLYSGIAAYFGHKEWLEFLLTHEKLGVCDAKGYHVLHYAILGNQSTLVAWLLSVGIDPLTETAEGENAYILAQRLESTHSIEILVKQEKVKKFLQQLKQGQEMYDAFQIDPKDGPKFLKGPKKGNLQIIEILNQGVAINATYQPEGKTLLQGALETQNVDILIKLVQLKVRTNIYLTGLHPGWTSLHYCASHPEETYSLSISKLMMDNLSSQASQACVSFIRQRDARGKTAYHYAVENNFVAFAQELLKRDPEISIQAVSSPTENLSSDQSTKMTPLKLSFLSEHILPATHLSSQVSLKPHLQHKDNIYLLEMTIPAGKSPLPLLFSSLNSEGRYQWKGSIEALIEQGKKKIANSLDDSFCKAFHQLIHHLYTNRQQGLISNYDSCLFQSWPFEILDNYYKEIKKIRQKQKDWVKKLSDYCNRAQYREEWLKFQNEHSFLIASNDLFSVGIEKILDWLEHMVQTYDKTSLIPIWFSYKNKLKQDENSIHALLKSPDFPFEMCHKTYFQRLSDPKYWWGAHDLIPFAALQHIPYVVINDYEIDSFSLAPISPTHRLIVKHKDESLNFYSYYAQVQSSSLSMIPLASSPDLSTLAQDNTLKIKTHNPSPPSSKLTSEHLSAQPLHDFLKELDTFENSSSGTLSPSKEFFERFEQLWTQFADKGLDEFFIYIFTRLNKFSQKKSASLPLFPGQRWTGTLNQFSLTRRDKTPWPEEASRASCTVNALTFLSYLLPLRSIKEWETKCSPDAPLNNIINEIIDTGREHFEKYIIPTRTEIQNIINDVEKNEGQRVAEALKKDIGGDALSAAQIPQIEQTFSLEMCKKGSTIYLECDPQSQTTVVFFEKLLKKWQDELTSPSFQSSSLGIIFQINGYSYALALLRNVENIEYVVFDSHGSEALNGNSHAFAYSTLDLSQASQFLGHLVKAENISHPLLSKEKKLEHNQAAVFIYKSLK